MSVIRGAGAQNDYRTLVQLVEQLRRRKGIVASGDVDLAVSPATETTVSDGNVTAVSEVLLAPAEQYSAADTTAYVSSIAVGEFTITHGASANVRTYRYHVFG